MLYFNLEKKIPKDLIRVMAGYVDDLYMYAALIMYKSVERKWDLIAELGSYYEVRTLFHTMPPQTEIKFGMSLIRPFIRLFEVNDNELKDIDEDYPDDRSSTPSPRSFRC